MGKAALITIGRWIIAILAAVLEGIALSCTGRLGGLIDGRRRTRARRATVATVWSRLALRSARRRRQRADHARVATACSKLTLRVSSRHSATDRMRAICSA